MSFVIKCLEWSRELKVETTVKRCFHYGPLREPGMLISRQYVYVNPSGRVAELVSINHIQKRKVLANLVLKERVKLFFWQHFN